MRRPGDDAVFTCVLAEQVGLPYRNFELNPAKRAQLVRRSIVGEGSRPRDPRFAKPHVVLDRATKVYLGAWHVFPAREDARPPRIAPRDAGLKMLSGRRVSRNVEAKKISGVDTRRN